VKVGDLIKLTRPTTRDFNSLFIVAATIKDPVSNKPVEPVEWIQVYGLEGWKAAKDYEAV
tara:strand:+ start:188 stop:367 length:180 start_codon:yes stop_codon:yes gene_type:complete